MAALSTAGACMFQRIPPATRALLIANVVVFLLQLATRDAFSTPFALWPLGGDGYGSPGFMPWQLLTYGFMHGGFQHLFFNMLALYMFGGPLEQTWGSRRFTTYYLICIAGAGLCQLAVGWWMVQAGNAAYPTLGASGGVFGLLLAYGMLFPYQQIMLLFPPIPMKARTFVILYGVAELFLGFTGLQPGVAHFAHLGGMLFGWLVIRYWRGQPPFGGNRRKRPPLRSV